MIDRLDRRAEGIIPIQCHITFMKRTTREWLRFVDRHPALATLISVAALGLFVGSLVLATLRLAHG